MEGQNGSAMRSGRTSGTATVLFTDLVGSTELMTRLGDAAFDDLRGEHFARLREAMASCGGQEVKNTGDGLLVTFASVVDALAAAVAAQHATDRHSRSAPAPVAIRVGLALGEVAFEDGDVFGTPVVEAARLVGAARPGQILATTVVRVVAGSRADVEFRDLGTLELKGLPDPVPVCEVAWEPLATSVPLPPLFARAGRIFVGRDGAVERLAQLRKEVAAGERRVALLAGEPGIGKTRLATEVAMAAHLEGTMVLAGRCDEDLGVPFQPFVEALRHYAAHSPEPRLGRYGAELTRLVPELAGSVPGLAEPFRSDPETERYRLFDAVAAWLADVSAETPVLLVLDDVHWAAKPTLLLLRHVLSSAEPLRLLVVVTYRDSEVGRGHPLSELLSDLRRLEGVERFHLTGLDQAGVSAFIEAAAGHGLTDEEEALPRVVWAETEGNPFFVAEVLRHLLETGGIEHREGRWTTTVPVENLGIPEGVRDVVGRRLSRLSKPANRVLGLASVVGLEFEPAVVRAAGDLRDDELLDALDEAVAARLLTELPDTRYRFAHALVRATLYEEITAARRVGLHQRVAEAIEAAHAGALDDHLPALAHHWARAAAPAAQTTRAVHYAARAGDRALAQLAHDEAAAYYRQALQLIDAAEGQTGEDRRLDLLISLGEAQRRAGDPEHRDTLLRAVDLARQQGDADGLARAALANRRPSYWSSGGEVDAERVTALEAALAAMGDAPTAIRARLLAALGIELVYTPDRARRVRMSDEGLEIARTLGDETTLAQVLMPRFFTIHAPDTMAERQADTAELLRLAESLRDPLVEFMAHFLRTRVCLESGDLEHGLPHLRRAEALATELGQPILRWMVGWMRVGPIHLVGRIAEAELVCNETLEIGLASAQPDAAPMYRFQQWAIRFEQGRAGELESEFATLSERFPAIPGLLAVLALLCCEAGHYDEARKRMGQLAAVSFHLPRDPVWLGFMTVAADVARRLHEPRWAEMLYDLIRPYPTQLGILVGIPFGCGAHSLGMLAATLGRFDEAEDHFGSATGVYEKAGAPAHLGRTRIEWARTLLARRQPGDAEQARRLLDRALAPARELGLVNVERRAVALLSQTPWSASS